MDQLNVADLVVISVVDAKNRKVNSEIQVMDDVVDDPEAHHEYNIVFVPFITIDNDGKSVTLLQECLKVNTSNRTFYLLESFMTTFYKQPTLVLAYQDVMKE
ncbi:hypothetical protein CTI12_AA382750 [Artemisia annua]|uniref:Uncharacterized protein n=1 Tax=Artemisia annua TaxID=35608 RepID=A0A2U1MGG5_ARTAN|nr:hypothetical protein CTI12_AA382750 [Artemisia annua]